MATATMQSSDSIIAGYFQSGEDAHRAINALLDEGFLASQIGAAFHTSGSQRSSDQEYRVGGDSSRESLGTTVSEDRTGPDSIGGPLSDTTAVQPGVLGSGSGTPFMGAGQPHPISGSNLQHTGLPSEFKHELPHDQLGSAGSIALPADTMARSSLEPQATVPSSTLFARRAPAEGSWTAKLKHLFQPKHTRADAANVDATNQNFGTGEGQLDLDSPRPYSQTHLEGTATRAGLPSEQSRHLSTRLGRGGAIVTVSVTGRATEVERIFEEHNGEVRFSGDSFDDRGAANDSSVELFGHLQDHYAGASSRS